MIQVIRFYLLFVLCFLINQAYAAPPSIARYALVGTTREGTVAAFMLTHFGPSSHAPFASLIIKKAGVEEPLFQDGAYRMDGGEKELADLVDHLLEKNHSVLKEYEIDIENQYISEAHMAITDNRPESVAGWVDIINGGTKKFMVKSIPSEYCSENPNSIDLEFWFNGVNKLTLKQKPDSCWDNGFSIRNIYQTQKALWFIINKHEIGLASQNVYFVDIAGIALR